MNINQKGGHLKRSHTYCLSKKNILAPLAMIFQIQMAAGSSASSWCLNYSCKLWGRERTSDLNQTVSPFFFLFFFLCTEEWGAKGLCKPQTQIVCHSGKSSRDINVFECKWVTKREFSVTLYSKKCWLFLFWKLLMLNWGSTAAV